MVLTITPRKEFYIHEINNSNNLQSIVTQAIEKMESEHVGDWDPDSINLAELGRRTSLTRAQLRRLKQNNF